MSFTSEQPGTTRSLPSSASAIVVPGMEVHLDRFAPADVQAVLGRRYIVGPEIGAGGQGVVFRATRIARPDGKAAHDDVALKLHFCLRQDIRVQREIAAMENVCHANMARLIEHGFCDVPGGRTPYLAWEFIEGLPVHVQLKSGPLLESEVLAIGRDVSAAISEIWSRRIVHGDIKPSNIMVRNSGGYMTLGSVESAVLIDLGAAKYLDQENARTLRPSRDVNSTDAPFLKPAEDARLFFAGTDQRGEGFDLRVGCFFPWHSHVAMLIGAASHGSRRSRIAGRYPGQWTKGRSECKLASGTG